MAPIKLQSNFLEENDAINDLLGYFFFQKDPIFRVFLKYLLFLFLNDFLHNTHILCNF